ncbi:MAG: hypothetical protein ACYC3S_18580 [Chloroflexota bacterium]
MPTKRVVGLAVNSSLVVLALAVAIAALGGFAPVARGAEGMIEASVTVVEPARDAYTSAVLGCTRCLRAEAATGAPDGESSILFHNGEIELTLSQPIFACDRLTIWAAGIGWGPSHYRVFVSADGKHWRDVGRIEMGGQSAPDIVVDEFGTVRFIKVVRSGWALGAVLLDAIRAEGGGGER